MLWMQLDYPDNYFHTQFTCFASFRFSSRPDHSYICPDQLQEVGAGYWGQLVWEFAHIQTWNISTNWLSVRILPRIEQMRLFTALSKQCLRTSNRSQVTKKSGRTQKNAENNHNFKYYWFDSTINRPFSHDQAAEAKYFVQERPDWK